jgi:DNA repair protein RadA/Sms
MDKVLKTEDEVRVNDELNFPMAKIKTIFACQSCGSQSPKWQGKCPDCGEWNTFAEETFSKASQDRKTQPGGFYSLSDKPISLGEISLDKTPRYKSGLNELDRVLGGGVVPGSLVLLGGDPGIGKSTLILQALDRLAKNGCSVLYVTGEESKEQIKMRADRLKINAKLMIVTENILEKILVHADTLKPQILVVDSIQTVFMENLESAPGSVSQIRECAGKLLYYSKSTGCATLLIGHVTKDGAIAGPRLLEHMVDTVLYFEGEHSGAFRILRTIKNRFGSTQEIGVFEMTQAGLLEVGNPSEHFLRDRGEQAIGSCVTTCLEGTRPILVEVQALVGSSNLATPRRTTVGIDSGRVALITAVLEKFAGVQLFNQDLYISVAGGFKLTEPAADVAVMLALMSSFRNKPLPSHLSAVGEIGLTGEIRSVSFLDKRLNEAVKLGYNLAVIPQKGKLEEKHKDLELLRINTVADLVESFF